MVEDLWCCKYARQPGDDNTIIRANDRVSKTNIHPSLRSGGRAHPAYYGWTLIPKSKIRKKKKTPNSTMNSTD